MNEATRHRGPDGTGYFVDENISFGHNLLAITETAENSRQPVVSEDKNYALVYNGEIYNYKELRKEFEVRGRKFRTDCDTEVLFRGLIEYGAGYLEKLDGMFAFGFYDKKRGTLLLARDPAGIKPLYYYHKDGKFIFSSEKRGIFAHDSVPRKLDERMLGVYFTLGYVPGPKTLICDIFKVSPGQCLTFNLKPKNLRAGGSDIRTDAALGRSSSRTISAKWLADRS